MTEYTMYRVQKTVDKLIGNEKLFNKYSTVTKKKITLQIFPKIVLAQQRMTVLQMRQPRVKINQNDQTITRLIS